MTLPGPKSLFKATAKTETGETQEIEILGTAEDTSDTLEANDGPATLYSLYDTKKSAQLTLTSARRRDLIAF